MSNLWDDARAADQVADYLINLCGLQQVELGFAQSTRSLVGKYLNPVEYAEKVLHVSLTPVQQEICQLACEPPYKVLVRSGHNVGKSFVCAVLVCWWFDTFDPGFVLTTAPSQAQVRDILWKEVRWLRARAKSFDPEYQLCFPGPKDTRLETHQSHWAHGFTARDSAGFQGKHGPAILIIFDEAQGVDEEFWTAAQPMLGGTRYAFVGIYNPTDQTARVYHEETQQNYHPVVVMDCFDHPNIVAELKGEVGPVKDAIHLGRLKEMLVDWATPIALDEVTTYDVTLDETKIGGEITYWRPGPVAEARLLGRWPRSAINAVWSEVLFDMCLGQKAKRMPDSGPLQIGVDVARYGDDNTSFFVRKGGVGLWRESHNGWSIPQTVERCKQLASIWGTKYQIPVKSVPIVVDDSSMGGGVTDYLRIDNWGVFGVNASDVPDSLREANQYPNLRSFLWFGVAEAARKGLISFARLPASDVQLLKDQLFKVRYTIDVRGRRVVESKDEMKERTGRSPDDADSMNLAYLMVPEMMGAGYGGRIIVEGVRL